VDRGERGGEPKSRSAGSGLIKESWRHKGRGTTTQIRTNYTWKKIQEVFRTVEEKDEEGELDSALGANGV